MTDRRFEYDEGLLESCARSKVAHFVANNSKRGSSFDQFLNVDAWFSSSASSDLLVDRQDDDDDDDKSCIALFELHRTHYGRQHTEQESLFLQRGRRDSLDDDVDDDDDDYYETAMDQYELGGKMEAFLRNVIFVYQHNAAAKLTKDDSNSQHVVSLNRFSDRNPGEILTARELPEDIWSETSRRRLEQQQQQQQNYNEEFGLGLDWNEPWGRHTDNEESIKGVTVLLSTSEQILNVAANLTIGKGSMNKLYKYKKEKKLNEQTYDLYPTTIDIPTDEFLNGEDVRFATPALTPDMDGALLSIKRNKNTPPKTSNKHDDKKDMKHVVDNGKVIDADNNDNHPKRNDKKFKTHLNWATTDNPDGISIVHDAFDQVCTVSTCFSS